MRVVFCNRHDAVERPGGDTIQMFKTKEYLEKLYSLHVNILLRPDPHIMQLADIIHIFNLQSIDETLAFARIANSLGKPIAISTIFWDLSHMFYILSMAKLGFFLPQSYWINGKGVFDKLVTLFTHFGNSANYYSFTRRSKYREAISYATVLLPNSYEEAEHLSIYVGQLLKRVVIVKNALDNDLFQPQKHQFNRLQAKNSIICVGRIEPAKNQLGLLSALSNMDINIRIIGQPAHHQYFRMIQKYAQSRRNVELIPQHCSQEELVDFYSSSAVHVLPSFRESPGLASLEALAMGCNIVVSEEAFCPVRSYFADLIDTRVFTCNPYSPKSIRSATEKALSKTPDQQATFSPVTWNITAEQTMHAYKGIL